MNARISRVPQTPYTQEQSERYSAEADDGNNDEYSRKRREYEEESIPTREEYEANQREAEREIEYNSQRELDDLEDESEADSNDDTYLEPDEFSGNYFSQPEDESEPKESLGDRIREKYNSFSEKISSSAGSAAGSFISGFNKKMDSFERGDPIFNTKRPATKKRSIRYVSRTRQNKNLSRPYVGGRFDDSLTNAGYNPYYPVNAGRQSASPQPTMDMYLPSGGAVYEGEFSGRKAFKREFSDERESYDLFGFGRLSGDGFANTSGFGSSLMGFGGNDGLFGGSAGNDNVLGFGGKTGKMDILGNSGMFAIGGDLVNPPASRKTTTKRRKSTSSKPTKKATKKTATKRRASPRKQASSIAFALP